MCSISNIYIFVTGQRGNDTYKKLRKAVNLKMCKKQKKVMYDGYFTVEASLIVPIAFLLMILLLYFGLYCYEKSISVQCCYLAALRGSNEWDLSGKELEQYVNQVMEQLLEEKHLYEIEKTYSVDAGIREVTVMMEENIDVPFAKARGDDINVWEINSEKEAIRNIPSVYIRKYQMLVE